MIYEWKCTYCDMHVDVERSIDDNGVPPKADEVAHLAGPTCLHPDAWVKVFTVSTPFEMLKDKGIFERTHWKPKP